jgi:uncharacterized OB-fold protein
MSLDPMTIPEPDELSAPFFAGLAQGRLMIQTCVACGTPALGVLYCAGCGAPELAWREASGRGRIWSFAVVHVAYNPAHAGQVPYNAASIELEEGPRLFAEVLEAPPGELVIGEAVDLTVLEPSPGRFVPAFSRGR